MSSTPYSFCVDCAGGENYTVKCNANQYYTSGFAQLQIALDSALIRVCVIHSSVTWHFAFDHVSIEIKKYSVHLILSCYLMVQASCFRAHVLVHSQNGFTGRFVLFMPLCRAPAISVRLLRLAKILLHRYLM